MPSTTARRIVGIITILAVILFCVVLVHAMLFSSGEQTSAVPSATPVSIGPAELPVRLSIPKLRTNAKVQMVGVAKSGNMAVPTNYTDVGWYRGGTVPGQLGSAVMDGHVDNALALDGVFKHLDMLAVGDDVYVTTAQGHQLHFVVKDVETYPVAAVPLALLFNRNDAARLNLVTCAGSWVQSRKMYDRRTVVYTVLAS